MGKTGVIVCGVIFLVIFLIIICLSIIGLIILIKKIRQLTSSNDELPNHSKTETEEVDLKDQENLYDSTINLSFVEHEKDHHPFIQQKPKKKRGKPPRNFNSVGKTKRKEVKYQRPSSGDDNLIKNNNKQQMVRYRYPNQHVRKLQQKGFKKTNAKQPDNLLKGRVEEFCYYIKEVPQSPLGDKKSSKKQNKKMGGKKKIQKYVKNGIAYDANNKVITERTSSVMLINEKIEKILPSKNINKGVREEENPPKNGKWKKLLKHGRIPDKDKTKKDEQSNILLRNDKVVYYNPSDVKHTYTNRKRNDDLDEGKLLF